MSVNVPGENSGTKGQTGTKGQGQRQGYSLQPYGKQQKALFHVDSSEVVVGPVRQERLQRLR